MNATEAVEAWMLWELLPDPKRLHCEYSTYNVLVGEPWREGMGPPGEMHGARIWTEGATPLEAIRAAVEDARELQWIEVQ